MHYIGCLSPSGYNIVLLRWSPCVLRCAPFSLCDLFRPLSVLAARRVLRSAARGELLVPQAHLATVQRRALSVVGPSAWNDIPVLCLWPALPNFTFPSSPSSLAVTELGAPLNNSQWRREAGAQRAGRPGGH